MASDNTGLLLHSIFYLSSSNSFFQPVTPRRFSCKDPRGLVVILQKSTMHANWKHIQVHFGGNRDKSQFENDFFYYFRHQGGYLDCWRGGFQVFRQGDEIVRVFKSGRVVGCRVDGTPTRRVRMVVRAGVMITAYPD